MDVEYSNVDKSIGTDFAKYQKKRDSKDLIRYINLKLAAMGYPYFKHSAQETILESPSTHIPAKTRPESESMQGFLSYMEFIDLAENIIQEYQEKTRLLSNHFSPADERINHFLKEYFQDLELPEPLTVPKDTLTLDQYGIARETSLPPDKNEFINNYMKSYRIKQGILHNPKHDRRTTENSFHIVRGGPPVPLDKLEVPKLAFARMFQAAVNPPDELLTLPFTSSQKEQAKLFASLLLRPIVCPEVPGVIQQKSMEIRFFAPGACISTLDFVESVFGNAGDPMLSKNDAGLDTEHWVGVTGCIIIAPHLIYLKKKDLGLPHWEDATQRQRKEKMCWKHEDELYNDGNAFKITCRNASGNVITLIADNYFGYSKKEVKTQLSYAANLYGLVEEEHAGGCIAYPRRNYAEIFMGEHHSRNYPGYSFEDVKKRYQTIMNIHPDNYGVDKTYPNIIYVPENTTINLYKGTVSWEHEGTTKTIKLLRNHYYVYPTGYKIHMQKHPEAPDWQLISTRAEGMFCHKPCTVSGGGKSEISKPLENAIIHGSFYVQNLQEDLDMAETIINYDYANRWKQQSTRKHPSRKILSPDRSLGSVIKLLTPSLHHTQEFLDFLDSIPIHVKALVLFIKRFYREEWGDEWRKYFTVDKINGKQGHSLMYNNRKVIASYLRVGLESSSSWFVHKLRTDFVPAAKIQMEDDISASITLPQNKLENLNPEYDNPSSKLLVNCEYRFFQRPDEAIHRGYDKQAEADLAKDNNFATNYEPLTPKDAQEIMENAITFEEYTQPIKDLIHAGVDADPDSYFISPAHPRIVDGAPSKNPRYLQLRPDFVEPEAYYLAEIGTRFHRKIELDKPVFNPVNAVLPGRRNNPPDKENQIRCLSVYNPIHYQELPELFMDFICSLTGKSPSTTGAGSEGALTKGPFNMLIPTSDLNNALVSYILTGYNGFTTPAGYVGSYSRFDHDISILIPELWCRLRPSERDPKKLIKEGSLERLKDFEHDGKKVLQSRLGYRITSTFLFTKLGKVFTEPMAVFSENMLKPELQDMNAYVDGINNIIEAQKDVAARYFEDGSIEAAIPPLQVLLHIMVNNEYQGKTLDNPLLRKMFTREYLLQSEWYQERLHNKQKRDIALWERQLSYIESFMENPINAQVIEPLHLAKKVENGKRYLEYVKSDEYLENLEGTLGADPLYLG